MRVIVEPEILHDGEDEFAEGVELRQPLQALTARAVRDIAVICLKPRIPAYEITDLGRVTHSQHSCAHAGAVPDPGAGIAAQRGSERRTVAIDQDARDGSFGGVGQSPCTGREVKCDISSLAFQSRIAWV